jgi:microcompartment protein CcmL/EutN
MSREPALGLLEVSSIARGFVVADAVVKKAPVRLLRCHTVSPGKHLTLLAGGVDEVFESMRAGESAAGSLLLDKLFLPQVHPDALRAASGVFSPRTDGSLGIVEYFSVASALVAADAAVKTAAVEIVEMRLAQGIGGKGFFVLSGELNALEAAIQAALRVNESGLYCGHEIIANPHPEFVQSLVARLA